MIKIFRNIIKLETFSLGSAHDAYTIQNPLTLSCKTHEMHHKNLKEDGETVAEEKAKPREREREGLTGGEIGSGG